MNTNDYTFYNMNTLKSDTIDKTQRSIMNSKFANYYVSNFYPNSSSDNHVQFATQEPNIFFNGSMNGLTPSSVIDIDSTLLLKPTEERSMEKLDLNPRLFATIPFLGRGTGDTLIESKLLQGESSLQLKSVSTIMEQSFMPYREINNDEYMKKRMNVIGNDTSSNLRDGYETRHMFENNIENKNVF